MFAKDKKKWDDKKKKKEVKKDFNYFIEQRRPKTELLEWLRGVAYRLDVDLDDLYSKDIESRKL